MGASPFPDGTTYARSGKLNFSDVRISNVTGTSEARAELSSTTRSSVRSSCSIAFSTRLMSWTLAAFFSSSMESSARCRSRTTRT